jgi:three-Cys-motif partner protein
MPDELLWDAEPHTIAKTDILGRYLDAWLPILGSTRRGQDLLYVDGFAGPGKYANRSDGSPTVALRSIARALSGPRWVAGKVHVALMEKDKMRCQHLEQHVSPFGSIPGIELHIFNSAFSEGMPLLRSRLPHHFQNNLPLFGFIDPFGATGVPWEEIRKILVSRTSEVLLNFDADGMARILGASDRVGNERNLSVAFGDDSWRSVPTGSLEESSKGLLDLYKAKLRGLPRVKYTFSFEMRRTLGLPAYHLIFASQVALGLEKMKESMKALDQAGLYQFVDSFHRQVPLFRVDDDPAEWARLMATHFAGSNQGYEATRDFALNVGPYTNPKKMLRWLEANNMIEVVADPGRKRGTFNPDVIRSIKFED